MAENKTSTPDLPPRFQWVYDEKIDYLVKLVVVNEWRSGWTILAGEQLIVCDGAIRPSTGDKRIVSQKVTPQSMPL